MEQSNGVDLLYERSENFGALTSFGVIPAMGGLSGLITGKVPGLHIDLSKVSVFHYTCSQSRFRFVGVSRLFFDKLVMSRFHGQVAMSKRLPKTERLLRQIAQPFSEDNSYVVI